MSTKLTPLTEPLRLFDGYIETADLSVGYGANGSTCQISLVYDDDGPLSSKDYRENFPELGTCVGLKIGETSFAGVFQRYVERKDIGGYRWDIILEAPGKVLDGVQVVLDGFQGTGYSGSYPLDPSSYEDVFTNQMNNVWNPFAIKENFAYGGNFGGADVNSSGYPVMTLLPLLEEISRSEHDFGGPITFGESEYTLDLTPLIDKLNTISNIHLLRVKGPVQTLSAILTEICDFIMHDFVVTVHPRVGDIESGIISEPKISIKLIDKSAPADTEVIKNVVEQYERDQKLSSANVGKELTDIVTQRMVIGGNATRYFVTGSAIQIWGKTKITNKYTNHIILDDGTLYLPDLLEIRCAMASFETWLLFSLIKKFKGELNPDLAPHADKIFSYIRIDKYVIDKIVAGTITPMDLFDTTQSAMANRGKIYSGEEPMKELERIYNAIKSAGDEFYGRKFLVPLPLEPGGFSNNIKFIKEDQQYVASWEITDSAWTEGPTFSDIKFYDNEGKLKPTVVFPYDPVNGDYSQLGGNFALGFGGIGTVVDIEPEIYWLNILGEILPYAVVSCDPVDAYDGLTTQKNGLWKLLNHILGVPLSKLSRMAGFDADNGPLTYPIAPDRAIPFMYGVPQRSTRYMWGPWWQWTNKKGRAEVRVETELKPETYGGFTHMLDAGNVMSYVSPSEMSGVESGYIEVAELPSGNLGDRFAESGPYVTNMSISLGTGGIKTNYKFNTWTPQFGKLQKYNLDRIANIQKSTIQFLQDQRNRLTKQGFPAFKFNEKALGRKNTNNGLNLSPAFNMLGATLFNNGINVAGSNMATAMGPMSQNYTSSYFATPEQIFSPIKIKKTLPESQDGPEFIKPTEVSDGGGFEGNQVGPTAKELSPHFAHDETDFGAAGKNSSNNDSLSLQENADDISEVRTMGLRGPLMLSGWGYDLNDQPTNTGDEVAKNRGEWKTGPVDLKWDEERGVWSSGFHLVEGILSGDITAPSSPTSPTTFSMVLKRGKGDDWDDDQTITVTNRDPSLEVVDSSSTIFVMAVRVNYEWRPLWVGCE